MTPRRWSIGRHQACPRSCGARLLVVTFLSVWGGVSSANDFSDTASRDTQRATEELSATSSGTHVGRPSGRSSAHSHPASTEEVAVLLRRLGETDNVSERIAILGRIGQSRHGEVSGLPALLDCLKVGETTAERVAAAKALHELTPTGPYGRRATERIIKSLVESYGNESDGEFRAIILSIVATRVPDRIVTHYIPVLLGGTSTSRAEKEHLLQNIRVPPAVSNRSPWMEIHDCLETIRSEQATNDIKHALDAKIAEIDAAVTRYEDEHSVESRLRKAVETARTILESSTGNDRLLEEFRHLYLVEGRAEIEGMRDKMTKEEYGLYLEMLEEIRLMLREAQAGNDRNRDDPGK